MQIINNCRACKHFKAHLESDTHPSPIKYKKDVWGNNLGWNSKHYSEDKMCVSMGNKSSHTILNCILSMHTICNTLVMVIYLHLTFKWVDGQKNDCGIGERCKLIYKMNWLCDFRDSPVNIKLVFLS